MGKKNKAKALFNAQHAAVASLQSATESPAAEQAAIPIFSLSTAGLADYEIDKYPVFLVAVQEFQTANNNSRALADLWNRAYLLGRENGEEDAWLKGHEQGYTKGQTAGFQLGMKSSIVKKDELASLVGHVSSYEHHDSRSGRVDVSVGTESSSQVSSAALRDDEVQEIHDEAWQDGYEDGTKAGEKEGFEKGIKAGITKMEETFIGHVTVGECSAGRSARVNAAVNTEQPRDLTPNIDWAGDAAKIPIHSSFNPRNLSVLSSGVSKPFSSLQRRVHIQKRQREYNSTTPDKKTANHDHCNARFNTRRGLASSIPHFTVTYSVPPATAKLDWDRDPRLMQLSCALHSLGWSPPS